MPKCECFIGDEDTTACLRAMADWGPPGVHKAPKTGLHFLHLDTNLQSVVLLIGVYIVILEERCCFELLSFLTVIKSL